jgi:gamma-glutamyltranspeptidase/glutathione hydrolase
LADDGLDPQAALEWPRFCIEVVAGDGAASSRVALEKGIPEETVEALGGMGHPVALVSGHERALFGRGQVIFRDPETGVLWGGRRADGCAVGCE